MKRITTLLFALAIMSSIVAQQPFAPIGSKWNYWFASAYFSGYKEFKVEKDTIIAAPFYGETEETTITCSKISIINNQISLQDYQPYPIYVGHMIAFRNQDVAYIYDEYHQAFFKWIDMNAEPGDKWLFPQWNIAPTNNTIDYVEVQYKGIKNINGFEVPYVKMMPSCTSIFDEANDYTSRIRLDGAFNIDFINLYGFPYALPNGENNYNPSVQFCYGLLCAKNGDLQLDMPTLEEYFKGNLDYLYTQGIVECDSLTYPHWENKYQETKPSLNLSLNKEDLSINEHSIALLDKEYKKVLEYSKERTSKFDKVILPVVFHIVHNPNTPEEAISVEQVHDMLRVLNEAYSATNDQSQIRDEFINVVGNPNIEFCLANTDPDGNPTTGIEYIETNQESFPMWYGTNQEKYGFKYDESGNPNSWNNLKYINIWIADLAFEERQIGGFVTNPVSSNPEVIEEWFENNTGNFWRDWILSEEGQELDGLTIDYWATFGGTSNNNPNATYNTSIHELGHFLGLRHTFVSQWGSNIYDDGFEDTPYSHYAQFIAESCDNEVRQCGNLIQVENFMDYAISCQSMFTLEQSDFMNAFLEINREELINPEYVNCVPTNIEENKSKNKLKIYPNPTTGFVFIKCENTSNTRIQICNILGKTIIEENMVGGHKMINCSLLNKGVYLIKVNNTTQPLIIE